MQPPPPDDDDASSACSDELLGSQSRRWLAELLAADDPGERASDADVNGERIAVGRDGLFVDYHFPLGELEMKAGVKWKRPKVNHLHYTVIYKLLIRGLSRHDAHLGVHISMN